MTIISSSESSYYYGSGISWDPEPASPPNIITAYDEWISWKDHRLAQFEVHCPLARGTTYYISKDETSSDSNSGLSPAEAWLTRGKAISEEALSSGNVAFLFKRGDEWNENQTWVPVNDNITIADFGVAVDPPLWNRFTQNYSDSTWTQIPATNAWTTSDVNTIGWVRLVNDRLGETRGTTLTKASSAANVQALANSWFWGANVLTVNLNGDDPNDEDFDLEACIVDPGDNTTGIHGVRVVTDGVRVENIRADGFGIGVGAASQIQGFTSQINGDMGVLFKGCEAYYGSTHVLAHWSSSAGGHIMFVDCVGGFGDISTSGAPSVFNSYTATAGTDGGAETWWIGCNAKYGRLMRQGAYVGPLAESIGFLCHTGTGTLKLSVAYDCLTEATYWPQKNIININSTDLDKAFLVDSLVEKPATAVHSSGTWPDASMMYGNEFYFYPTNSGQLTVTLTDITIANCYIELDLSGIGGNNNFGPLNGTAVPELPARFWQSMLKVIGSTQTTAGRFGIYLDAKTWGPTPGSGPAANSYVLNSIIAYTNADADAMRLGVTNTADHLINNAYYRVRADSDTTNEYGAGNTTNRITLASEPTFNVSDAQLLQAATSATPTMPRFSNDINGKLRTVANPDIGPVDYSSP